MSTRMEERIGFVVAVVVLVGASAAWLHHQRSAELRVLEQVEAMAEDRAMDTLEGNLEAIADLMNAFAGNCSNPQQLNDACMQSVGSALVQSLSPLRN
jgi:hypothetical protein